MFKKKKKKEELKVKTVGDLVIDIESMQWRLRDIPWFNQLAFQNGKNDLFSISYLDKDGKTLPVTHWRINFRQSVEMQKQTIKGE